jgi:poly(A) polymerase
MRHLPSIDPQQQREFAVEIVRRLRARGHEALWAGGCVRDELLGHAPKDYDIATSARPEQVREIFGMRRTVAVGAAFGVISVLGPKSAGQLDVVTFRQDKIYLDGRHPEAVEFSTPEADAQRRDFTINGLFYDPIDNRVIDFVGGRDDMARRVVRAIGDPFERFHEDKLRLLRAVRFATRFEFALDPATRSAIEALAPEVTQVSAERIAAEMRLMLLDTSRRAAVKLLGDVGLLAAILPELTAAREAGSLDVTLKVLDRLEQPSFSLALAALLHDTVSPSVSYEICRRWKLSNRDSQQVRWLVEHRDALVAARQMAWPRLQRLLIAGGIDDLLQLHEAIAMAAGSDFDAVNYCRELLKVAPDELDPPPLLTGDDLIAHGVARGKEYQSLLEAVRDAQLNKTVSTRTEALALIDALRKRGPDKNPQA